MAASTRTERQLIRQRGAGLRTTKDVDFGLDFGSKGSRDDRQLMRQRGAGNRKIDNIDFGFSFPTTNASRRSSSRLSSNRRVSVDRTSRTPSTRKARESSAVRSARGESVESRGLPPRQRSRSGTPQVLAQPEQPNSSKRRRLNKQTPIQISVDPINPTQSPRLVGSEEEVSDTTELDDHQAALGNTPPFVYQDGSTTRGGDPRDSSPLFFPENEDKENDIEVEHDMGQSSKKTRLVVNVPTLSAKQPLLQVENENVIRSGKAQASESTLPTDDIEPTTQLDGFEMAGSNVPDRVSIYSASEPSTKPTKKRKKRKPVILVKKKRRSSEMRRESSLQATDDTVFPMQEPQAMPPDEPAEDDSGVSEANETTFEESRVSQLSKLDRAPKRTAGRGSRLSVSASPAPRGAADEEGDETYIDEENSPEPPTPAPPRARKQSNKPTRHSSASTETTNRERGTQSYAIQTHRLVNAEALPTITEEDEDASEHSEAELFQAGAAISNRTQPNAVDVLAQVCRETIKSELDKLEAMSAGSIGRAEMGRKRTALEAFASDLDQRLFDMSEAVENRLTLEARLRKSKRELAELQARWIEVRRQRDETALKADAIRRQNWENEEEGKRQWEISELAHSTELEMEREVSDNDDLGFLLKEVTGRVGCKHGQCGILDRVKSFNGQLERLAVMLERR